MNMQFHSDVDGTVASLQTILHPRSVAIIGASDRPGRHGYRVVERLLASGYSGDVYPVNPRGGNVLGLPIYPRLDDVPGPVDLIDCLISVEVLPELLEVGPRLQTRGIVVYAAGFFQAGERGSQLEANVLQAARANNIRLIGPNTMGIYCAASGLDAIGSPIEIPSGSIGFISQSGNVGITAMVEGRAHGSGLSHFLGVGLQLDIAVHDCVDYLAQDDNARVIAIYLEGVPDGSALLASLERAALVKPIVIFKAGSTTAGAQAAASHSGSLAAEDRVFDAACIKAGVQRVKRSDELIPVANALATQPPSAGKRVALLGSGGGHTVQMGDAVEHMGLEIPPLPRDTADALEAMLPEFGAVGNPADFAGGLPERGYPLTYAAAAELGLQSSAFDGLIMFGMFGGWDPEQLEAGYVTAAEQISRAGRETGKPVVMHTIFAREPHRGIRALHEHGIPTVHSIEIAARCFAALSDRGQAVQRLRRPRSVQSPPAGREIADRIIGQARQQGRSALLEGEAAELLAAFGVPFLPHRVVRRDDLPAAVAELGLPVAVKVQSSRVLHKSERRGVYLNARTIDEAISAYDTVLRAADDDEAASAIVYQMANPNATELLLGLWRDPIFGPVVMVGLGGIFVEALGDVALRLPPIEESDVLDMLSELMGQSVLAGARGRAALDQAALAKAVVGLSNLAGQYPEVVEVDVNPLFAHGQTVVAADARVLLAPS